MCTRWSASLQCWLQAFGWLGTWIVRKRIVLDRVPHLIARAVAMFAPILHAQVERGRVESEFEDVRFGSKADIAASPTNVCFTPKSGH
jgi:hypothetical protein